MGSSRAKILLSLALVFALGTGYLVYKVLRDQQTRMSLLTTTDLKATVDVVVAGESLKTGQRLTLSDLATVSWPKDSVIEGAIPKKEAVVGMYLRKDMVRGEPILFGQVAVEQASAGGLTNLIEPGKRAITIEVDPVTGVGGFVLPGSHVDVLATLQPDAAKTKELITTVILQNIKVLAVDQEAHPLRRLLDLEKPNPAKTVTLLVTPDDAERLTLAGSQGTIHLVMRSSNDDQFSTTSGATLGELLPKKKAKPAPKPRKRTTVRKATPKPAPVVYKPVMKEIEVFRGAEREVEEFEEEPEAPE